MESEELLKKLKERWFDLLQVMKNIDKELFSYFMNGEPTAIEEKDDKIFIYFQYLDIPLIDYVEEAQNKKIVEDLFKKVLEVDKEIVCAVENIPDIPDVTRYLEDAKEKKERNNASKR
ncbi:MAG: hypothetical protein J7L41_05930 [Synergistetes bacterium]|nr:hypothetical protein [Synergistota bacterium]